MDKYTIAIAGSTKRTTLCAQSLAKSKQFEISWILTPKPKPIGRKKIITPNPLEIFAKENNLPVIYVEKKINESTRDQILKNNTPDFLLVVDFGYIVPSWLLELPKIAPLNIHPSELPKWRGSSPGQFSILFNDKKSAITLMVMNQKLDQGPIIHQDFFEVDRNWNQADYYKHAFKLICDGLDKKISDFGANPSVAKPQPENSPTITAGMLKKEQAFVDWKIVQIAMEGKELSKEEIVEIKNKTSVKENPQLSKLLLSALDHNHSLALTLERASKAFNPWPYLWTIVPTQKDEKRMKFLELEIKNTLDTKNPKLIIKKVQIEGKNPDLWNNVKNTILEKK